MKTIVSISFLLIAGTAAFAGVPQKRSVLDYDHLYSKSPFTNPPVAPVSQPTTSVFDDWALGGVSEVEGGYMVTLVHKKNAGETQIIKPRGTVHASKDKMRWLNPGATGSFKVERVTYGKESWKETTVLVSSGEERAALGFDDKQLTPVASAAPVQKLPPGQAGQQPQVQPRRRVMASSPGQPRLSQPK